MSKVTRAQAGLVALCFIISGLLSVPVSLLIATRPLIDDMYSARQPADGLVDPTLHTSGLYPPEVAPDGTTFRWTGPRATLTFPYAAHLGRHAHVTIRLSAPRPNGEPNTTANLVVNNLSRTTLATTPTMSAYTATLDTETYRNPFLEPSHLQVEIESETFISPSDGRELGVLVDEISVRMEPSRTQLAITALTWAVLAALVGYAASRYGLHWALLLPTVTVLSFALLGATYTPRGIAPVVETVLAGLAWLGAIFATRRARPTVTVTIALLCLCMVAVGRILGDWQMDDAYISYRYAQNLLQGNGLVYNPGEIVEGYTNFAWTLFSAASIGLGISPAGAALALNVALSMGLIIGTYTLSRRLWGGTAAPLAAGLLVAVDGAVLTYGARGSGMESAAFSLLILLAAALIWTGKQPAPRVSLAAAGVTLALAVLTRPEGFLVAAIYIGVLAWGLRSQARATLGNIASIVLPFLVIVIPYEVWRISFYGYLFPNTFYAKTGASTAVIERGWDYVSIYLGERWLPVGLAIVSLILVMSSRKNRLPPIVGALALLVGSYSAYIVWVGGDHFPGWRFLLPVVAPIAVLSGGTVSTLLSMASSSPRRRMVTSALLLMLGAYGLSALWLVEPQSVNAQLTALHTSYVNRWGSAGLWLRGSTPLSNSASAAAKGAGAIAYYSQRPVIDLYGLNDLHIGHLQMPDMGTRNAGHDKEDPTYVLNRRPDYILDEWVNYFDSVKGKLKQEYEYLVERSPTGPDLAWWRRKDASAR